MRLEDSIMSIKGIGEKNAALFSKLNIESVRDLIFTFPRSYEAYPPVSSLSEIKDQGLGYGAVLATVCQTPVLVSARGLNMVKVKAIDSMNDTLQITFFHMPYLKKQIKSGSTYVFFGTFSQDKSGFSMAHPKMFKEAEYQKLVGGLQPVYALTKGITNQGFAKYVQSALKELEFPADFNSQAELYQNYDFMPVEDSLKEIHMPTDAQSMLKARKRFSYEEFLLFLLAMKSQKFSQKEPFDYPMIETADANRLIEALPYNLTNSQLNAYKQIKEDMLSGQCMNRLLQGDVGSGKTLVALLAILLCVSNGLQAALMAPTEVLANQHMDSFVSMAKQYHLPFKPVLLTGSQTAKEKRLIYESLKNGEANVVIGTHAIIQDGVEFDKLGLVITDEQHRFGVKQRQALVKKASTVHSIVMSATPIPRSLAIILYGDLDISEMRELPGERLPIKNCVVDQTKRKSSYHFMKQQIDEGRQIMIICPMALPGVMEGLENVVEYSEGLKSEFDSNVRIAYLHGKMKPKLKNEVMERFAKGDIDILVSTTVIEVGVNVPNATVMMVENAERFGLATLHQIRGRVGRGDKQSYCIFMQTSKNRKNERLEILNRTNDGFEIANEDLKLRGPGDSMGLEQSGAFQFAFADIYNDADMLKLAAKDANEIIQKDATLSDASHSFLKEKVQTYLDSGYIKII